jgi:esterase/lipase superfamily enzyme
MEFKVYGHAGKPILVFPSSGGRFFEYEDFGMIEACRDFIEAGRVRFFTPDSIDSESWLNTAASNGHKNYMHDRYENYILHEFIPTIHHLSGWRCPMVTTGCSMGGYHALNFYLKHPDIFDTTIAQSGVYDVRFFTGGNMDDGVYFNSPVDYFNNLTDTEHLELFRRGNIIISTGQGRWEEISIQHTRVIERILNEKQIPAWVDYWGCDVDHDWPWWRIQMPYFLGNLAQNGKI